MGQRILILQLKRLGDLALTAPVVASLRAQLPDADLTLVCLKRAHELAGMVEGVDRVFSFQRGRANLGLLAHILSKRYDATLDLTCNDRSVLLTALSGARRRAIWEKHASTPRGRFYNAFTPGRWKEMHTVDHHLSLLRAIDLEAEPHGLGLRKPERPDTLPESYVLAHPGTSRKEKYWPTERWIDLIRSVKGPVLISRGHAPFEREQVNIMLEETDALLAPTQSFRAFAQVVAHAEMVVSVDTVTSHLAAAWERPQVTLFGPINPLQWRARHEKAHTIVPASDGWETEFSTDFQPGTMGQISVDAVQRAMADLDPQIVHNL